MDVSRIGIDSSVDAVFPPERLAEALSDISHEVTIVDGSSGAITDCQAVVTFAHHDALLDLDWVHSIQAGVDRFPLAAFRNAGVVLTNSTGIHGDAIGETVAGYVLTLSRRLHEHVRNQERREWRQPEWDEAWTVSGNRACVVGLGTLGRGIVDRLSGLGLDLVGVRRTPTPEPGVETVYPIDRLDTAVSEARFVVLAVPLTDATTDLVDANVFEAMRDDSYLVNVARGGVVDQSALVAALDDGDIAGAALDVFETEPLPASSPLWEMDEVIVSPHCGAFSREYHRHVAALVRESSTRIEQGTEPVNRVC